MKESIYGISTAVLIGESKNGMVELLTEFADSDTQTISFPIEAIPKLIKFLEKQIK